MVFERLQCRVARLKAEGAAVTMDHDIHEVGIFESDRGPSERRVIELPAGRPFAPQHPAQFAAVFSQAFAPAFRLEKMLIPEDALKRWCEGMPLSTVEPGKQHLREHEHVQRRGQNIRGWTSRTGVALSAAPHALERRS